LRAQIMPGGQQHGGNGDAQGETQNFDFQ